MLDDRASGPSAHELFGSAVHVPPAPPQMKSAGSMSGAKTARHEIKRDAVGVSEKLRRHAGNIPVLPQTKQCPHCPAKFTRSTHLNRHLKTHSSERLHKCDACQSEFTRTDLLSRHKKTCNGVSRSRRKSCLPCSESKIKCDLTYPCAKCTARGKECVVPGAKRRSNAPPILVPPPVAASSSATGSGGGLTPPHEGPPDMSPQSAPSVPSDGAGPAWRSAYEPSVTESMTEELGSALSYETGTSQGPVNLSSLYTAGGSNAFDGLFSGIFAAPEPTPGAALAWAATGGTQDYSNAAVATAQYAALNDHAHVPPAHAYGPPQSHARAQPHPPPLGAAPMTAGPSHMPAQAALGPRRPIMSSAQPSYTDLILSFGEFSAPQTQHQAVQAVVVPPQHMQQQQPRLSPPVQVHAHYDIYSTEPASPEELDNYIYLFFTVFSAQMPLLHGPTWTPEGKPPVLVMAMRAAGALYVRTERAAVFILETLRQARGILPTEFAKDLSNPIDRMHLVLATVLLQAVGLFHQQAEVRASHSIFHGMLVQMVRRHGLIAENAGWAIPQLTDAVSVEAAWRDWVVHESMKRAIMLSWVHDCCHVLYFGLSSSFTTSEFTLNLPCEDGLWQANTSAEWVQELQKPSPFGFMEWRTVGYPFQKALIALSDSRKLEALTSRALINAQAHWILIHTILRNIYALCPPTDTNRLYTDWKKRVRDSPHAVDQEARDAFANDGAIDSEESIKIQYVLHNWLTSWLRAPEVERVDTPDGRELPFMADALPFYWLAQVSLMALQERMAPFAPDSRQDAAGRFRLVKHWLRHVRHFLRVSGSKQPTLLWNEMMKIRLQDWQAGPPEDHDGLLGFFPEA